MVDAGTQTAPGAGSRAPGSNPGLGSPAAAVDAVLAGAVGRYSRACSPLVRHLHGPAWSAPDPDRAMLDPFPVVAGVIPPWTAGTIPAGQRDPTPRQVRLED